MSAIQGINFPIGNIGGGGGANHNILSTSHLDSEVNSCLRGYIIAGNISNLWSRLNAKDLRKFLVGDGTDLISRIIELADIPEIPKSKISTTGTWLTSELPSTIVYKNQANTYSGAGTQDFANAILDNIQALISNATIPATTGAIRLGIDEIISWRNSLNDNDIKFYSIGQGGLRFDLPTSNADFGMIMNGSNQYTFDSIEANWQGNNLVGLGYLSASGTIASEGFLRGRFNDKIAFRNVDDTANLLFYPEIGIFRTNVGLWIGGNLKLLTGNIESSQDITTTDFIKITGGGNVSASGRVRLQSNVGIGWRNNGNTADIILKVNASDLLEFNGVLISLAGHTHAISDVTSLQTTLDAKYSASNRQTAIQTSEISNDQVTYAKIQNVVSDDVLLGRISGANGDIEEITPTQARTLLNVADGANNYSHPNHSGDVTSTGDGATVIGSEKVTDAMILNTADVKISAISFLIDGSGSTITTGLKGDLEIPFNCVIERVTLLADQTGSIVIDIWKDTYANYPPLVADSITASAKPTITTATKSQDSTLTGWTTTINAGDTLRFNVDSITTIQRVTLVLRVRKT